MRAIKEEPGGILWFARDHGLCRYRGGKFFTYRKADGLSSEHISALHLDEEGALWIGTSDGGLNRLKDGRFTQFTVKDGFPKASLLAIVDDNNGYFWMSSPFGLHRILKKDLSDFADGRAARVHVTSFGKADGLPDLNCAGAGQKRALTARDGSLWLPTQSGLAVLNPGKIPRHTGAPLLDLGESLWMGKPYRKVRRWWFLQGHIIWKSTTRRWRL